MFVSVDSVWAVDCDMDSFDKMFVSVDNVWTTTVAQIFSHRLRIVHSQPAGGDDLNMQNATARIALALLASSGVAVREVAAELHFLWLDLKDPRLTPACACSALYVLRGLVLCKPNALASLV